MKSNNILRSLILSIFPKSNISSGFGLNGGQEPAPGLNCVKPSPTKANQGEPGQTAWTDQIYACVAAVNPPEALSHYTELLLPLKSAAWNWKWAADVTSSRFKPHLTLGLIYSSRGSARSISTRARVYAMFMPHVQKPSRIWEFEGTTYPISPAGRTNFPFWVQCSSLAAGSAGWTRNCAAAIRSYGKDLVFVVYFLWNRWIKRLICSHTLLHWEFRFLFHFLFHFFF